MDRRKALLVVAAVIAALGTLLVFLYVRGADSRADQRYDAVQVLRVVKQIAPGETVEAAQAAGKIEVGSVARQDLLPDALTGTEPVAGKVAVTAIYPKEQLTSSKFGAAGSTSALTIPKGKIAISVELGEPAARVAGFVNPGDKVAIFVTKVDDASRTKLLLPNVQVIGVGATTAVSASAVDPAAPPPDPAADPAAAGPMTLALSQADAERVLLAVGMGGVSFALLNSDSEVSASGGVTESTLFR